MAGAYDQGSTEAFHEWRKRVKYHLHHAPLLREVWESQMKARRKALDRLSDLLGDEQDLAVLSQHPLERPVEGLDVTTAEALHGLAASRRARLRSEALPLGSRLFADPPKALACRLGAWFETAWGGGATDLSDGADAAPGSTPPVPPASPAGA